MGVSFSPLKSSIGDLLLRWEAHFTEVMKAVVLYYDAKNLFEK